MPWSITVCCSAIVLVLCRLCDRLVRAINASIWKVFLFLCTICICEILPPFSVSSLVIVKPYSIVVFLFCASLLLANASMRTRIRAMIGSVVCSVITLLFPLTLPPEVSPLLLASFPVAIAAFLCGYTADGCIVSIMLSSVIAEISYAVLELPFFELGTSDFLSSACISGFFALILCRIFAHSPLADRRRLVADRVSHLQR
ncbi:MAG: hypothetical protein II357_05075 [Clostridia bacterium]|nr:hypothetical protein [Clostridia bacterium]